MTTSRDRETIECNIRTFTVPGGGNIMEHPLGLLHHKHDVDPVIDALRARVGAAEAAVTALREAGKAMLVALAWHHHEPSAGDRDTCQVCGKDVRNPVHLGEGPREKAVREAAEKLRAALEQGGE